MRKRLAALSGIASLVALFQLGARWLLPQDDGPHHRAAAKPSAAVPRSAAEPVPAPPSPVSASIHAPQAPTAAPPSPLPRSLEDSEVDGDLRVDAAGHLVIGPELRHFFDYFLSATGEEPEASLVARIRAALHARLPEGAAAEGEALLDRYLAYRSRGRALASSPGANLAERFDQIHALRVATLGPEVTRAFFGAEEAADRIAVQRQAIEQDSSLSTSEKASREAALEAQIPPSIRAARAASSEPIRLQQEEQEMRRAGATDEDLYQFRKQTSGQEAADRLAALDQQRADWKNRVAAFEAQRAQIRASAASPEAAAQAEQQLLEQSFTAAERIRVRVLESAPAH